MAKAFKCLHSCYLESNQCQLAISKPTGLPEPREINYNCTRIGRDSSPRPPGAREGRGRGRCVLTSVLPRPLSCAGRESRACPSLGLASALSPALPQMRDTQRASNTWSQTFACAKVCAQLEMTGAHRTRQPVRVTGVQTYLSPDYLGKDYLRPGLCGAGHRATRLQCCWAWATWCRAV